MNLSTIDCENHQGQPSIGSCAVCEKPLCGDCSMSTEQGIVCDNPEHRKILEDWTTVFVCESEFEADAIQRNLESAGCATLVFSSRDHVSTYWSLSHIVKIMVPSSRSAEARAILEELKLEDYQNAGTGGRP